VGEQLPQLVEVPFSDVARLVWVQAEDSEDAVVLLA
jgi:hypothetical protein